MCFSLCLIGPTPTGLLVFAGLQASGWSEGFSCPGSWTPEEAPTRASHSGQATYLCPLYELLQVCTRIHMHHGLTAFFLNFLFSFNSKTVIFCKNTATRWECPWSFRTMQTFAVKTTPNVTVQIPEAYCLVGKNKISFSPIWRPINKQSVDTRSFTAQSL